MYIFPLPKIFVGFGIFRVEDETEAVCVPPVKTGRVRGQGRNEPVMSQDWAFISG